MTWALNWWRDGGEVAVINVIVDYKVKYLKPTITLIRYIKYETIKIKYLQEELNHVKYVKPKKISVKYVENEIIKMKLKCR